MKLTELFLNRFLYRDNTQNLETKDSVFVSADSTPAEPSPIYSGGAAQDINTGNVQINGAQLEPGTFPQTVLDVSNWGWGQTCAFSSTDLNTVSWGAGTFKSADGTSYSISAGNTGNMAAKTYIYLSLLDSTTAYQITTTPGDAVGVGKVLVAVANPDTTTATYNLSEATQIVGDNILANSINASKITTGQLIVGTNVGLGTAFAASSAGNLAYEDLVSASLLDSTVIVGGYIKTSLLSADNIQTGELTVDPVAGKVSGINVNSGGDIVMNSVNGSSFSSIIFRNGSDGWDMSYVGSGGGGYIPGNLLFEPMSNGQTFSIGSFALTTVGVYTNLAVFGDADITGSLDIRNLTTGKISPASNASYDIGAYNNQFRNIYISGGVEFNGGSNFIAFYGSSFQLNASIASTGDIYAGSDSGSLVAGSTGFIVCRGSYFFPQSITYKDGSGVNKTKTFLVA